MGIPSYFSYIVKNYPKIIKRFETNVKSIDNLYLDSNSIIYDAYYNMRQETITEAVSQHIINQVILKIEEYISIIQPSKTVIIAFDGVAPVAKLEQQRNRRYKSWYQNEIRKNIFSKKVPDVWNTASITPGTKFMSELNKRVAFHFSNKPQVSELNIIVTGSDKCGEGEHKIYEYIRNNKEKHLTETTIVYGLDADLIMLSINHLSICPNLYLFRETPHFIQSIDNSLDPNEYYLIDIPMFSSSVVSYMNTQETNNSEKTNNNEKSINNQIQTMNKLYDYIFMCFMLGNDFMPHFPAINIRTGGIDKLLNAYRATIHPNQSILTENGTKINWNMFANLVKFLAKLEEEYIIVEHKQRSSREKRGMPETSPEEKFAKFEKIPLYDRELETYINPFKPCWQTRYYKALFNLRNDISDDQIKDICINYLQGIEWTMKYYTTGCPDWRWKYKYNYPPLLCDLIKYIPVFDTEFVSNKEPSPVSELVQLCYVLPKSSLNLLPDYLYYTLIQEHGSWYKSDCDFIWAYCMYFWEAHVDLSEIDIQELEKVVGRFLGVQQKTKK
jgi:5'-3' exonuclease